MLFHALSPLFIFIVTPGVFTSCILTVFLLIYVYWIIDCLMSTLTDFLIQHQETLGSAYVPLMTLYMLAVISPVWSLYLVVCSLLSIIPKENYPFSAIPCLVVRLIFDAILNPFALIVYTSFIPWFFKDSGYLFYFFYTNIQSDLSILPISYFCSTVVFYLLWYQGNHTFFKQIKPSFDFHKEYLITFYSPSRVFGSAALMIVLFDFDGQISFLLWSNVYVGAFVSIVRYTRMVYYAYTTSHHMLTNR